MSHGDENDKRSRISIIEGKIAEMSRSQSLVLEGVRNMHQDLKGSLENFVVVMKVLTAALVVELAIQAVLMSVLILRDSPKEFRATREGFSITGPTK